MTLFFLDVVQRWCSSGYDVTRGTTGCCRHLIKSVTKPSELSGVDILWHDRKLFSHDSNSWVFSIFKSSPASAPPPSTFLVPASFMLAAPRQPVRVHTSGTCGGMLRPSHVTGDTLRWWAATLTAGPTVTSLQKTSSSLPPHHYVSFLIGKVRGTSMTGSNWEHWFNWSELVRQSWDVSVTWFVLDLQLQRRFYFKPCF